MFRKIMAVFLTLTLAKPSFSTAMTGESTTLSQASSNAFEKQALMNAGTYFVNSLDRIGSVAARTPIFPAPPSPEEMLLYRWHLLESQWSRDIQNARHRFRDANSGFGMFMLNQSGKDEVELLPDLFFEKLQEHKTLQEDFQFIHLWVCYALIFKDNTDPSITMEGGSFQTLNNLILQLQTAIHTRNNGELDRLLLPQDPTHPAPFLAWLTDYRQQLTPQRNIFDDDRIPARILGREAWFELSHWLTEDATARQRYAEAGNALFAGFPLETLAPAETTFIADSAHRYLEHIRGPGTKSSQPALDNGKTALLDIVTVTADHELDRIKERLIHFDGWMKKLPAPEARILLQNILWISDQPDIAQWILTLLQRDLRTLAAGQTPATWLTIFANDTSDQSYFSILEALLQLNVLELSVFLASPVPMEISPISQKINMLFSDLEIEVYTKRVLKAANNRTKIQQEYAANANRHRADKAGLSKIHAQVEEQLGELETLKVKILADPLAIELHRSAAGVVLGIGAILEDYLERSSNPLSQYLLRKWLLEILDSYLEFLAIAKSEKPAHASTEPYSIENKIQLIRDLNRQELDILRRAQRLSGLGLSPDQNQTPESIPSSILSERMGINLRTLRREA